MPDTAQQSHIGDPAPRIEARSKVTGEARYASDRMPANMAHAFLVTSAIARGRVAGFQLDEAKKTPGFLDVLTHQNVGSLVKPPPPPGGKGGKTTTSLESDRIWHAGQIIAVVVAETPEAAREAAGKVRVSYVEEPPSATFDSPGAHTIALADVKDEKHEDPSTGNPTDAVARADAEVDAWYTTPAQHHNPIELFTTTCDWRDGKLVIYEPSQWVNGLQHAVAKQLSLNPADVHVISGLVGGAFGSRGGTTQRTAWIALASKRLKRPVRLEPTRQQGFTIVTFRAETNHHLRLAAGRDGKFRALMHEAWEATSRPSTYNVSGTATTARLYACPNVLTRVNVVQVDRNTPGFMRAPPETPYLFPLESAVDELAYKLGKDPLELRRINDTSHEPIKGLPYTSRHLITCLDAAAERFDWKRRDPVPASMRDGDWLIGLGCASAAYPANIAPGTARVTLRPNGEAQIQMAVHDMGTGAYTAVALVAADRLGLPISRITVLGADSDLPPAGLSAGSMHAATTCNVVAKACEMIRDRLARAAVADQNGAFSGLDPATLRLSGGALTAADNKREPLDVAVGRTGAVVEVYAENVPRGLPPDSIRKLYNGELPAARGSELKDEMRYAFGAQFVEVAVHARTREVRVRRAVGAFSAGQIINARTAESQLMGGMIWGISAALHEQTEIDRKTARYYNTDLAEYLIPVNADIPAVDVILIPEQDQRINELGIKGIGELGITGMNAAVANAVFHATGIRIRDLPIRMEKLLPQPSTERTTAL